MNGKIWKALGIAVCMLALAAPHAMAETITHMVTADTDFAKVVKNINASGVDDENVIELCADITLTGNHTLKRSTTIKSKDEDRKISINGSNAGITVTGERTVLNLGAKGYDKKLTIEGDGDAEIQAAFVTVSEGATANMYENVTLQNRKSTGNACIVIMGSKSVFNMRGGVTENCSRAVIADSGATFHMFDGEIKDCKVYGNGVILVYDNSKFIMEGGTISECEALTDNGGGLYAENSTINISGGTIKDNKAAYGGGVALIDSTIQEIKNWKVIGNEAYETGGIGGIGGGIKLENGSMKVSDGSNQIYNNKADRHGADVFLYNGNASIKLPNAANMNATYRDSGIEIDGWYNDNPPYTPSENGVGVDVSGELTGGLSLVASYKTILVRIEIDANGGVGGSGSQTVEKGKTVTLEAPTKEGHLFTGWKDEKGNSYPAGADGKVNITVTEDMTLTAEWKKLPSALVRIEIDANGGVGGSGSQTVQKGTTVTLEAPTKEGHLFTGWKDEKGNSYPAGADGKVNITVNEDMKLTAVWEARTFTVTYVLLDGKTRTETVAYGQKLTLGEEPRTGYTFVGWKDGEKMYHAGETITVTEDMTLTAEWEKLPSAENLPKTGDESPVLLWSAVLAVSAAAGFMLKRKK